MNHVRHQLAHLCVWALLLVLGAVPVARAQGTASNVTQYSTYTITAPSNQNATGWFTSQSAACNASLSISLAYYTTNAAAFGPYTSGLTSTSPTCQYWLKQANGNYVPTSGPVNYAYGTMIGPAALPCPASGTKEVRNVTEFYTNSPNSLVAGGSFNSQSGVSTCMPAGGSSCGVSVAAYARTCWMGTQPTATGLYRASCDYEVTHTGNACTPTPAQTAAWDSTAPSPACNGTYGTVGNKPVCIPSSTTTQAPKKDASGNEVPTYTGNPPAGSNGGDSLGSRNPSSGNGANGGSPTSSADGQSVKQGAGMPANGGTQAGSSGGTVKLDASDIQTDCDKKPNSVGCSEYGTPDDGVQLGNQDSGFSSISTVAFGVTTGCPAPEPFEVASRSYVVSFQPLCDNAANYIRPVVLVLGAALAAFVFIGGFRS